MPTDDNGPKYVPTPVSTRAVDGPEHHPTKQLPAMTDRALPEDLTRVVKQGFSSLERRLDLVEGNVDITGSTVRELSGRITRMEDWRVAVDERVSKHSGGTRQLSQNDAAQDRAIAETLIKTREQTETLEDHGVKLKELKTAVVTVQAAVAENTFLTRKAVAGFFKTPLGQSLLVLVASAIGFATNWLTSHGGH
jgi:hypothetical protein